MMRLDLDYPAELVARLEDHVEKSKRSKSALMRQALHEFLQRQSSTES